MDKKFTLRLPDEKLEAIRRRAEKKHLSANAYLEKLIDKDLKQDSNIESFDKAVDNKCGRMVLNLTEEEMKILSEKAEAADVSPRSFIKECIRKKSLVTILIKTSDLDELLEAIYETSRHLNGLLGVVMRSGAFKQDVSRIVQLMTNLNDRVNQIYIEETENRQKLYAEARQKILGDIQANTYKRRKTSRGRKGGAG